MMLDDTVATARVTLRAMGVEMAETFFHLIDGDREHLGRTLGWVQTLQSVEEEVALLEKVAASWRSGEAYHFALYEADTDVLMGAVGVHGIDRERRCAELGYWITSRFEGRGLVSEAVMALVQACFDAGFERLEIRCSSRNPRSSAVAIRCGFDLAVRVEDGGQHPAGVSDQLVFARLKSASQG